MGDVKIGEMGLGEGYMNGHMALSTALLSEGAMAKKDRRFTTDAKGKLVDTTKGSFWAEMRGNLSYWPVTMIDDMPVLHPEPFHLPRKGGKLSTERSIPAIQSSMGNGE